MVFVGQRFGSGLECFWLRGAHEVVAKCTLGLQSSEGLAWAGRSTSKVVQSQGWLVGAGCWWETSVPVHMGLF